jgi:hypothetical protein
VMAATRLLKAESGKVRDAKMEEGAGMDVVVREGSGQGGGGGQGSSLERAVEDARQRP